MYKVYRRRYNWDPIVSDTIMVTNINITDPFDIYLLGY